MMINLGFPRGSDGEESACNARDLGSIPGLERSPGEGMATHSSILARRIPGTEEPGRLQYIGWQRVGHVCVTDIFTFTFIEAGSGMLIHLIFTTTS